MAEVYSRPSGSFAVHKESPSDGQFLWMVRKVRRGERLFWHAREVLLDYGDMWDQGFVHFLGEAILVLIDLPLTPEADFHRRARRYINPSVRRDLYDRIVERQAVREDVVWGCHLCPDWTGTDRADRFQDHVDGQHEGQDPSTLKFQLGYKPRP